MNADQIIALLNLLHTRGVGPQRVRSLVSHYRDPSVIHKLSYRELCAVEGVDTKTAQAILEKREKEYGREEWERIQKRKVAIVTFWDPDYPVLLKKIYDPPVILYTKGQSLKAEEDCVAVVGTRKNTPYGKQVAKNIVRELVQLGITIVSGLARGIDTLAHRETLNNRGRTIAVLGSGIDVMYPAENRSLAMAIRKEGTIVSEFEMGANPDAGNFPQRNRIISGLCQATIVVEAGHHSGAILTALNAVDQNREVFAVPGRVTDAKSVGCLRLIRNGAIPLENASQVLEHIQHKMFKPPRPQQQQLRLDLTRTERKLWDVLGSEPKHIDEIVTESQMGVTQVLATLLGMELKGAVIQLSGKQFVRA
ncbi:MAG: DNA-processing protein DprA [Fidelibacterota bacterium]